MTLRLKTRKKILSEIGWVLYGQYLGETLLSIELENWGENGLETIYYIQTYEDLEGILENVPKSIKDKIKEL